MIEALLVLLGTIVVVGAVGWLIWRRRGASATRPRLVAKPVESLPEGAPRPGEIWWAEVPFEEGSGSKHRPCLVLGLYRDGFHVLKITSQQKRRVGYIRIPTREWDPKADQDSYLDVTARLVIVGSYFDRKAGDIDTRTWNVVERVHRL
ncbi:type II toxin-antitoxin system PemK/MazF family toxin [Stackebrandtia soli]|uniref:type II toxin-antitoxin system PemK/MazF family toxin n=1 Tax=Stackebrandtia soli TaxID=1892856 RepID=UPI0039E8BDE7